MNVPQINDYGDRTIEARDKTTKMMELLGFGSPLGVMPPEARKSFAFIHHWRRGETEVHTPNGILSLDVIVKMLEERGWIWCAAFEGEEHGDWRGANGKDLGLNADNPFDWFAAANALIFALGHEKGNPMVVIDPTVPDDEVHIREADGTTHKLVNVGKPGGDWFCPNCTDFLSSSRVENDETCDTCGADVEWHEADCTCDYCDERA